MAAPPPLEFDVFRLDLETEKLLRDGEPLRLGPKAFAVLRCLVERSGEVVRRGDLLRAVWPETHVTPAVLKVAILEIRRALEDDAAHPRFVETVPRVGYRFVGATAVPGPAPRVHSLVGREPVLRALRERLSRAQEGRPQIVFLAGEAGIGKTAVLEAFVAGLAAERGVDVAWGACLEHHGVAEAYLPVLDAVGRLCRGPSRDRTVEVLASHAPTWLVHLPAALAAREVPARELVGSTPERMLREMADALLVLAATRPLVLVLDDLHWSDYATLDLLALLARRPDPARLLVLASYRPVDAALREHPLPGVVRELRARAACDEIALGSLTSADVAAYLAARFRGHAFPDELAEVVWLRTDGNALFLVRLLDELLASASLVEDDGRWRLVRPLEEVARLVPATLGELIEQQVRRLEPERQRVLETASLVGREFDAAAVAAGMEIATAVVEEHCDELVRQGAALAAAPTGTLPDGTPLARYRFTHALYPEALAARMPRARRMRAHAGVARWLESASPADTGRVAAQLAHHREQARQWRGAIASLRRAADEDMRRCASHEAVARLGHAHDLLAHLAPSERDALWPDLQDHLGRAYRAAGDRAAAADAFRALAAWARERGAVSWQARASLSLASLLSWDDAAASLAAAREGLALAARIDDPVLRAHLESYVAYWRLHLHGWRAEDARAAEEAVRVIRASPERGLLSHALFRLALFEGTCGRLAAAARSAREGIDVALAAGDAYECMACHSVLGGALRRLGDWGEALRVLDDGWQLAVRNGHRPWAITLRILRAMLHLDALDFAGGAAIAREALDDATIEYLAVDAASVLGLALAGLGRLDEADEVLAAAPAALGDDAAVRGIGRPWRREALATLALARGDAAAARRHAADLGARARTVGDPGTIALAERLLAEAALRDGGAPDALAHVTAALAALAGFDFPTMEWRLHALAAQAHRAARRAGEAAQARARARGLAGRLAASLPHGHALRAALRAGSAR